MCVIKCDWHNINLTAISHLQGPEHEEMSMLTVQLATKFLFQVGFRTKKLFVVQRPIGEYSESITSFIMLA